MNRTLGLRPLLGLFAVSVAAAIASAFVLNPQHGPLGWFTGSAGTLALRILAVAAILLAGLALTYVAARLALKGFRPSDRCA